MTVIAEAIFNGKKSANAITKARDHSNPKYSGKSTTGKMSRVLYQAELTLVSIRIFIFLSAEYLVFNLKWPEGGGVRDRMRGGDLGGEV